MRCPPGGEAPGPGCGTGGRGPGGMPAVLPALVVLLAALLPGCRPLTAPVGAVTAPPAPVASGRLLVGLATEGPNGERRAAFPKGTPVVVVLVVQNRGEAPVRLSRPTTQLYDFWIERDGREVWRWSAGRTFASETTSLEIAPGDTRLFRGTWPQTGPDGRPIEVGSYAVHGVLLTGGEPLRTPPLPIAVIQ